MIIPFEGHPETELAQALRLVGARTSRTHASAWSTWLTGLFAAPLARETGSTSTPMRSTGQ